MGACAVALLCLSVVNGHKMMAFASLVGVYAFLGRAVLRKTQDPLIIAAAITVVGLLTMGLAMTFSALYRLARTTLQSSNIWWMDRPFEIMIVQTLKKI